MNTGWIKLYRKTTDSWVFSDAELFRAWIVILFDVNHSKKTVLIKGKLLECLEGDSLNSLDSWGKKFGNWSKGRVSRFFKNLEKDGMIILKNEQVTTRLTVCNYLTYQDSKNADGVAVETQSTPQTKRTRATNKNEKNVKNEKEEINTDDILAEYLDLWNKSSNTISYNPISSDVKKQLKKKIITREKSIDNFKELLTKVINKPFLDYVSTGKWLTFDWVMKSSGNAEKLLRGAYTDENLYQVNTAEAKRVPKVQSVPKIGDIEVTHKFYDIANTMRTNHIRLPEVLNEDVIYEFNANKENFPTGFVDQFMGFYNNQLTGVE